MRTDIFGTLCFALAIVHGLGAARISAWAHRRPRLGRALEPLAEVELTFAIWAAVYLIYFCARDGVAAAVEFWRGRSFHEPLFIMVILAVCSTGPVLRAVDRIVTLVARRLRFDPATSYFASALIVGPLLGSLVTEPAAMTVTAMILRERLYARGISARLRYQTLAVLFVNVSIGGLLSTYASPPILMATAAWRWDWMFMLRHFAAASVLACVVNTAVLAWSNRDELRRLGAARVVHQRITARPNIRGAIYIALFLGGLVVLGPAQRWWVEPLITGLPRLALYVSAIGLTAITDNAALVYLGAQVPSLDQAARLALVSGAVVGGGLTVIANAPNAAGFAAVRATFDGGSVSAVKLLTSALLPTGVTAVIFLVAQQLAS